jgi:hypothetical protein
VSVILLLRLSPTPNSHTHFPILAFPIQPTFIIEEGGEGGMDKNTQKKKKRGKKEKKKIYKKRKIVNVIQVLSFNN